MHYTREFSAIFSTGSLSRGLLDFVLRAYVLECIQNIAIQMYWNIGRVIYIAILEMYRCIGKLARFRGWLVVGVKVN